MNRKITKKSRKLIIIKEKKCHDIRTYLIIYNNLCKYCYLNKITDRIQQKSKKLNKKKNPFVSFINLIQTEHFNGCYIRNLSIYFVQTSSLV